MASLWKVDDEATGELMTFFYDNLWRRRLGPLEALRQAQLSTLRGGTVVGKYRGIGPTEPEPVAVPVTRTHPRFWAAWVLSGDPGLSSPGPFDDSESTADPKGRATHSPTRHWPWVTLLAVLLVVPVLFGWLRIKRGRRYLI
jgi:hypothetical protein